MLTEESLEDTLTHGFDSFTDLVREHQSMVFSIAYACLRDWAAAEDAAQDVFLELYRSKPVLESPAHLLHWLRRVAAHRAIDRSRRLRFRLYLPLFMIREPAAPVQETDLFLDGLLRELVASLPPKQRMVVVLRFQEDLGPTEIAEILDIPVRTVKSYLQRSLAFLRDKLERRYKEIPL
jgi:RNA polymerase sigma-70 factor (ECF subfamily)